MDFLPVEINGNKVYAGFWKRFCAGWADVFIFLPFALLFTWLEGFDRTIAIIITILSSFLFLMSYVYFNARFGGTPGKLVVGIRITRRNGTPIGWTEALKRSSVDLIFAILMVIGGVWTLAHVDPTKYASLGWMDRTKLLQAHEPSWFCSVNILQQVWIWSEVVILLFNKRKRAIHDFIAGTVVIHKQFAEPPAGGDGKPAPQP